MELTMKHRSYRGRVLYITDGVGEMGREWFHVTIQPDGTRTMRATCEMDDDRLLRDVVATLDADWRPVDAFVRLTFEERFLGSSWFRFTPTTAECQGVTARDGRFHQLFELPGPVESLGTHPVHADTWYLGHFRTRTQGAEDDGGGVRFTTSTQANGGSGPLLHPSAGRKRRRYIGRETITVRAGRFTAEHFQDIFPDRPPADLWATPEDCAPIRISWPHLKQSYELVELSGDAR
jgi:hypothetical protein